MSSNSADPRDAAPRRQRILDAIRAIPAGQVRSYGGVARSAGLPGRARLVARCLRDCPPDVPWHRVVNSQRKLSTTGAAFSEQRRRLIAEGVQFDAQRRACPPQQPDALLPAD